MRQFLPLPLFPAWSDDFFGMFCDSNDPELIRRVDRDGEWFWWTTSS